LKYTEAPGNQELLFLKKSMNSLIALFKTLRYKQWAKNLLLFAGIIFVRKLTDMFLLKRVLYGFITYCLISSALYIFNDIMDLVSDRDHPRKRNRPIASGAVSIRAAVIWLCGLGLIGLIIAGELGVPFFLVTLVYIILTVAYTLYFKKIVIIDVMIIATGFVLRTLAGTVVINIKISSWLLICTLLLALFLALVKRRQEISNSGLGSGRKTLESYPITFLDQAITIVTGSTLTGYFLYAFSSWHGEHLLLTVPFVIYGVFRYLLLIHRERAGEEPEEVLFSDLPFLVNLALWVITCLLIIYLW